MLGPGIAVRRPSYLPAAPPPRDPAASPPRARKHPAYRRPCKVPRLSKVHRGALRAARLHPHAQTLLLLYALFSSEDEPLTQGGRPL